MASSNLSSILKKPLLLWIHNLEQLVQVCSGGEYCKRGIDQDRMALLKRSADNDGCSIAIDIDGRIALIGHDSELRSLCSDAEQIIDGKGCSLIPGLVDAHTHPVWAGDRAFEFDLKARGATYMDIHQQGGGIHYTVRETRKASHDELNKLLQQRLWNMLHCGTTLVECKTGYGLDFDSELKQLEVLLQPDHELPPVDRVVTFLGAHAVPENMNSEEAVTNVLSTMMRLHEERSDLKIDFVDVFCEHGVFNLEQSRRILLAGRSLLGAHLQLHAEQLSHQGSAQLAVQLGARCISHAEHVSVEGIAALAASQCSVVLCPASQHVMRSPAPPVRRMLQAGIPIALGSDFCPNAHCHSMAHTMHLAVLDNRLSPTEALVGATINAAYALDRHQDYGSLEIGKWGDCVLVKGNSWLHLIYQFGDPRSVIRNVIKRGQPILFPAGYEFD